MFSIRTASKLMALAILVAAIAVLSATAVMASTSSSAVIDFEGLAEGQIVDSVASGNGISGDPIAGSVSVSGIHPSPRRDGNHAMIFDATCSSGCTGDDDDLLFPDQGNVLIISEDGDSTDPDDTDVPGAKFEFDFSGFGPGAVTIHSIDVMDVEDEEAGGTIEAFAGGTPVASAAIPVTGDNGIATVSLTGAVDVDFLRVTLQGSGAIDNIEIAIEEEEEEGEGCTPGFWKQPQHFDSWVGYAPSDSYDAVFGLDEPSSFGGTLLDALERGGGGEAALGRHATAALLNSTSPDVDYLYSTSEVIQMVQAAYAPGGDFESVKDMFEEQNELGCGLD